MKFIAEEELSRYTESNEGYTIKAQSGRVSLVKEQPERYWRENYSFRRKLQIISYIAKQEPGEYLSDSNLKELLDEIFYSNRIQPENIFNSPSIFLDASTGVGKNYFLNEYISSIIERERRILILCNRAGLLAQTKMNIIEDIPEVRKRYGPPKFTPSQLQSEIIYSFGKIDIMTYQSFINRYNTLKLNEYTLVIADEIHYLISDATFNATTKKMLKMLIYRFKSAKKIFISATPEDVVPLLVKDSGLFYDTMRLVPGTYNYLQFKLIRFFVEPAKRNYILHCIEYSTDYDKQASNIMQALKLRPGDKTLIFVDSKKIGVFLKKFFSEQGLVAKYIDKDSKQTKVFQDLIEHSTFESDILITTSVSYNGINIEDENLKHVVVFAFDKVQFLQSIGRVRINKNNPNPVNIYAIKYDVNYLIQQLEFTKEAINEYYLAKENPSDYAAKNIAFPAKFTSIYYDYGKKQIVLNSLALSKFELRQKFLEEVLEEIQNDDDYCFKLQCEWLNMFITEDQIIGYSDSQSKIIQFISKYENETLSESDGVKLLDDLKILFETEFNYTERKDRQKEHFTAAKTNNCFKEYGIPYHIDNNRGKLTVLKND